MVINSTCNPGSGNSTCVPTGSSAGLAAGLTIFFLLLVIIVGVIVYKYHSLIRSMVPFGQRKVQEKEDYTESPQGDPNHYTGMTEEQSVGQSPIYENLTTQTAGYNQPATNQSRITSESEENVYLQCDAVDEGIYSNDPAHDDILPNSQEDDIYIVPE